MVAYTFEYSDALNSKILKAKKWLDKDSIVKGCGLAFEHANHYLLTPKWLKENEPSCRAIEIRPDSTHFIPSNRGLVVVCEGVGALAMKSLATGSDIQALADRELSSWDHPAKCFAEGDGERLADQEHFETQKSKSGFYLELQRRSEFLHESAYHSSYVLSGTKGREFYRNVQGFRRGFVSRINK